MSTYGRKAIPFRRGGSPDFNASVFGQTLQLHTRERQFDINRTVAALLQLNTRNDQWLDRRKVDAGEP